MILLSWAKQQVWWPIVRALLASGARAQMVVPSLPPGREGLLKQRSTGGMIAFVVDPDCPEWLLQFAAPVGVTEWLLATPTAPAAAPPQLPYLSRFVEVGEA